jgi:hypothetical protein
VTVLVTPLVGVIKWAVDRRGRRGIERPAERLTWRHRVIAGAFAVLLGVGVVNVAVAAYAADVILDGTSVWIRPGPGGPPPPPGPPTARTDVCAAVNVNARRFSLTDIDVRRADLGLIVVRADDPVLAELGRALYEEGVVDSTSPDSRATFLTIVRWCNYPG